VAPFFRKRCRDGRGSKNSKNRPEPGHAPFGVICCQQASTSRAPSSYQISSPYSFNHSRDREGVPKFQNRARDSRRAPYDGSFSLAGNIFHPHTKFQVPNFTYSRGGEGVPKSQNRLWSPATPPFGGVICRPQAIASHTPEITATKHTVAPLRGNR